jgi:hypothetical protein
VGAAHEDPYRLQTRTEQAQGLAIRQQGLALQLIQIIGEQRELAALWEATGAQGLAGQARQIEESLRDLSGKVLHLERDALDLVARAISDEAKALRQDSGANQPREGADDTAE